MDEVEIIVPPGKASKWEIHVLVLKPTQVLGHQFAKARELSFVKELGKLTP